MGRARLHAFEKEINQPGRLVAQVEQAVGTAKGAADLLGLERTVSNRRVTARMRSPGGSAVGQRYSASDVLALQRTVGNRAATTLVKANGDSAVVQRKMAFTAEILGSTRSTMGKLKGARTKDTLWQIQGALRAYEKLGDRDDEIAALKTIKGMCQQYITKHGGVAADAVKVQTVNNLADEIGEELDAEAMRSTTQGQALDIYLNDLSAAEKVKRAQRGQHGFSQLRTGDAASGAAAVRAGGPDLGKDDTAAHKIAEETGLTTAHLAGIRVFGAVAGDYKYMNPVLAGDDKWLHGAEKDARKDPKVEHAMKVEGSLHAAVALDAMRRLPREESELWRGDNRPVERIPKRGETVTLPTTQSWSPDRKVSESFVFPQPPDRGVMFHLKRSTQGRRVSDLKGEGMSSETELTLLPGYRFKVLKVSDPGGNGTIEIECEEVTSSAKRRR